MWEAPLAQLMHPHPMFKSGVRSMCFTIKLNNLFPNRTEDVTVIGTVALLVLGFIFGYVK